MRSGARARSLDKGGPQIRIAGDSEDLGCESGCVALPYEDATFTHSLTKPRCVCRDDSAAGSLCLDGDNAKALTPCGWYNRDARFIEGFIHLVGAERPWESDAPSEAEISGLLLKARAQSAVADDHGLQVRELTPSQRQCVQEHLRSLAANQSAGA